MSKRRILNSSAPNLGSVLIDLGYCTESEIQEALVKQTHDISTIPLGILLVRLGIITEYQLDHAVMRQRVLKGQEDPNVMRKFGTNNRNEALSDMAERFKRIADASMLISNKVKG